MGDAETGQLWEMTRLAEAYTVWLEHLRAQAAELSQQPDDDTVRGTASALLFGGSGLTAPYPASFDEGARRILDLRAADLDAATLYVLSPSMCDVVIAAAQTLTVDDLALLDEDDLPGPTGLLMLPHPILVRAVNGSLGDTRAIAWTTPAQLHTVTDTGDPTQLPAVRFTSYLDSYGPVRPDSFRDMAARAHAQGTPLPPLLADGTRTYPYRVTATDEMRRATARYGDHARARTTQWRELNTSIGLDHGDPVDDSFEYHPGDEITDSDDLFSIRFLYAFWRLCAQHISDLTDAPAGHSARLQADRAGVPAEVRVATMRTPTRTTDPGEPGGRDWKHRWVVRMHKVRQWYPTEQRHKVIYRGPYVKGPADKPLLGGEVVRGMTR